MYAMQVSRPGSARYRSAEWSWSQYNTNHCCDCLGGPNIPQILVVRAPPTTVSPASAPAP